MANNLITELICTRLSHDIIGNIGAVANAVELLEEGDLEFLDDIKSILKNSSQTLTARLKFFRMAFGLDNATLEDAALVRKTAQDYLATLGNKEYPILLNFNVATASKRKLALQMIMIMADVLIRGGNLEVIEKEDKIIASIAKEAKISGDKLDKIKQALYAQAPAQDAGMAPLYALKNDADVKKIDLINDDTFIRLILE